ncbi:hypothetical protein H4R33_004525 [Dimargaris cristalligena]|uniref:Peroxisomal-coenzyme A synthetase n=1 Tax=Dimargaris cristalligena TaxID=215637 RepID=A0A4Q0A3J5_9FUNG|nr:hypothetical protein H4R33_004525 [Dimargaris cristalligena]RKP40161.1 hypothetical protein BJ085DRAFT_33185 [Dimargaris cristalligena]|eukprot:RKP40161.1 hypothetical protein BJ085DRAFT_33185 [Dimargaris cristalligena]
MSSTFIDIFARNKAGAEAIATPPSGGSHPAGSLSYHQLKQALVTFQRILADKGAVDLQPGDVVSSIFPNSLECVLAFLGTALYRCTAAPMNPALTRDEFDFYLNDSKSRLLLVPQGTTVNHPAVQSARACSHRCAVWVLHWDTARGGVSLVPLEEGRDNTKSTRSTVANRSGSVTEGSSFLRPPQANDTALLLHTSGTTGRPKAVPLSHGNITQSMRNIVRTYQLTAQDRTYLVMPLFHVHGLVAGLLATLLSGGTVVLPRKFSASHFWPDVLATGCTWYTAVPTIHQILLRHPAPPPGSHRLRFIRSCSSALAPVVHKQLEASYGVPVLEAYAMTEAAHQMTSNPLPPRARKAGSVGLGFGVDVAILDDAGRTVPQGTDAEVCVRGPNVTKGYLNNPQANATSFHADGGWFRTGDQGHLDAEGYLVITGRIKELINRGGEKISPLEVDAVLLHHPDVADAVSFAVPDEIYGQEVHAAVVPKKKSASSGGANGPSSLTEEQVKAYCLKSLAPFKVPKRIYIVEDFPRTATGKIQRRIVAQHFLSKSMKAKL